MDTDTSVDWFMIHDSIQIGASGLDAQMKFNNYLLLVVTQNPLLSRNGTVYRRILRPA
jgi:hypothetical protein